jgi:hypothetical protein
MILHVLQISFYRFSCGFSNIIIKIGPVFLPEGLVAEILARGYTHPQVQRVTMEGQTTRTGTGTLTHLDVPDSSVLYDVSSKTPKDDTTNMTGWLPVCTMHVLASVRILNRRVFEQNENMPRSFYGAGLKGQ